MLGYRPSRDIYWVCFPIGFMGVVSRVLQSLVAIQHPGKFRRVPKQGFLQIHLLRYSARFRTTLGTGGACLGWWCGLGFRACYKNVDALARRVHAVEAQESLNPKTLKP